MSSATPSVHESHPSSEADSVGGQNIETLNITSPQAAQAEAPTRAEDPYLFHPNPGFDNMNGYPFTFGTDLPAPPKPFARDSRVFTSSTDMSTESSRIIRNRLSGVSASYMKQVTALVKKLTVKSSSDLAEPTPFGYRKFSSNFHPRGSHAAGTMPEAAFALPGDFLIASQYQRICRCQRHLRDSSVLCWCAIMDEAEGFSSVNINELLAKDMTEMDLCAPDCFGNTRLHLLAACDHTPERLLSIIPRCADPFVVNSANQTLLQVLSPAWFTNLQNHVAPLRVLLRSQRGRLADVVKIRDPYGSTFLHRLHDHVKDESVFHTVLQEVGLDLQLPRDAFDNKARILENGHGLPPRRAGTFALSPLLEDNPEEDQFTRHHSQLLKIVTSAGDDPSIEDDKGRNALHCIAEAILNVEDLVQGQAPRRGSKRKHGKEEAESVTERRLETVERLIVSGVDVNHYDRDGNTVLIAFINHLDDDKDKGLDKIFDALLNAGASINARNQHGETALLVSARLGRKTALTKLLERGANVHVRDADGRGIIDLIDHHLIAAKNNLAQYGRLEACMSLLSGKRSDEFGFGIVPHPSLLDEWCLPHAKPQQ